MPSARAPPSSATQRATTPPRTGSPSRRWRESRRRTSVTPGYRRREGLDRHGRARPRPADAGSGAGTTFSTTNNQEAGVDEPDIAKTDGSTIFTLAAGQARGRLRHRRDPQARRDARSRYRGRECAAAALRQPRARRLDPFDDLHRAAADRRVAPRLALLGLRIADGDHRGRRARPLGAWRSRRR